MPDFDTTSRIFNLAEGAIWIAVAMGLPIVCKRPSRSATWGIGLSSFGFVLFGISDFLEASIPGDIPLYLLAYKVMCGAIILSGRYTYIGWKRFRFKDPFFLFGLFCLIAVSAIAAIRVIPL